ncbi:MAG: hypothetical protein V4654_05240 [Bdellovibrionota bacterium]
MGKLTFFSAVLIFLTSTTYAQNLSSGTSSTSCIESVCGKTNPFAHPFEENPALIHSTQTKLKDELLIEKPIKLYMGRLIHRTLITDQAFKYLLSQSSNFEVSPQGKAFLTLLSYLMRINEFLPALTATNEGYVFDQEKLKKLLPAASSEEITAIMSLSAVFKASSRLGGLDKKPLEMFLKYLHPDKTTLEAQVIEAQKILSAQNKLKSYMNNISYLMENDIIIIKAAKGESLNYLEKNHFKKTIYNNTSTDVILDADVQKKFSVLPLDISKILENFKNKYENSQQKKLVKTPEISKALLQENLNMCMYNLGSAYAALPNTEQLQNFDHMAKSVLTTAKTMIEEKFKVSVASDDLGIQIAYPEARDNMISGFKSGIKLLTEEFDKNFALKKSVNMEAPQNLESYLILAAVFNDSNVFEDLQEYCDRGNVPTLDDSALSQLKILNLSWPTIQHPELGISIFAHEIGHIVSRHYTNITHKTCFMTKPNYNSQYLEEDYADLFSAEVLNRLNYKIESTKLGNLSCALLPYDQHKGWLEGDLTNPSLTDSHSSSFYRLLAFDTMTTGLTPQCQDHLKTLNQNPFTDYCKWSQNQP